MTGGQDALHLTLLLYAIDAKLIYKKMMMYECCAKCASHCKREHLNKRLRYMTNGTLISTDNRFYIFLRNKVLKRFIRRHENHQVSCL